MEKWTQKKLKEWKYHLNHQSECTRNRTFTLKKKKQKQSDGITLRARVIKDAEESIRGLYKNRKHNNSKKK